jgi:hypothetical protein
MSDALGLNWKIDDELLGGYPHIYYRKFYEDYNNGLWRFRDGMFFGYPFNYSRVFRSFPDKGYWKTNDAIFDGYPHCYYRELTAPEKPLQVNGIALSRPGNYKGTGDTLTVAASQLKNIVTGDVLLLDISDSAGNSLFVDDIILTDEGEINIVSLSIPALFVLSLPVGVYTASVSIQRGADMAVTPLTAEYRVAARPTVSLVSITPDTVQLPITMPLTLTAAWNVTGDGVNTIQGNAVIIDTAHTANINTNNAAFSTSFTSISLITTGLYALNINITVNSTVYGSVVISETYDDVLTIIAPISGPEIGDVSLSYIGRYIGNEIAVTATVTGLQNILDGDSLRLQLHQSTTVFHNNTGILQAGAVNYSHTIPQSVFSGLSAGDYTVRATLFRGGTSRSEVTAGYYVVPLPTVQLIGISPDSIQLPFISPETISVTLEVSGDGVDSITGTVGLEDTIYTASVNTTNMNITVSLVNVDDLTPRGYAVTASLTVTSNPFGTASISVSFENALRVLAAVVFVPRNHTSGNIYIYNDFELVHILKNYISFKWVRRYNKTGEFLLQLENTPANVALIKSGNIITKDNDDEAGFIEDITIRDIIEVKGAFISKMLSYRVVNITNETPVNLQSTVNQLIRDNFIATTADRVVPGLRIKDYAIAPQNVLAKIENGYVEQWLSNQDAGYKVTFNPTENTFDFSMYDSRKSDAVFCESYRNITDQQYYKQTAGARNVCLVEGMEEQVITVGNAQGLARREAFVRAGRYTPFELGTQFLRQNKPVESLDVKIVDPYTPFEYKRDYDVGDIVTIVSQSYGVEITQNILEVTEFFDRTGFHLYVVFGSIPRDLLTELRDKDDRLDALEKMPDSDYEIDLTEENIETLKNLIIPELVDEIFDLLDFPPLTNLLTEDEVRVIAKEIVDAKIKNISSGNGNHIIIDHLPIQAEINIFPLNAEVLVYNPANPYIPPS